MQRTLLRRHEQGDPEGHRRGVRPNRGLVGAALGLLVVVAAACSSGGASSPTTSRPPTSTTGTGASTVPVSVAAAPVGSLGTVLVTASGVTLYRYSPDGTGKSVCTGGCAAAWPPLTVPAGTTHVGAGRGVTAADLGTIRRADGTLQVTYQGRPLYRYVGDTKPGQASGQGLEGTWFVVTPTASTASTGSTTTKPSGGYGY